jgi:hypothetical protein
VVSDWQNATASIEFNLGHRCDALRATFGLSTSSTTGGQAELGVLSDGTSVYDQTFELEQTDKKTISLDTPLKVKLTATDSNADSDIDGFGAFGNAQAHCTQ